MQTTTLSTILGYILTADLILTIFALVILIAAVMISLHVKKLLRRCLDVLDFTVFMTTKGKEHDANQSS
jgi:hypothetical protein